MGRKTAAKKSPRRRGSSKKRAVDAAKSTAPVRRATPANGKTAAGAGARSARAGKKAVAGTPEVGAKAAKDPSPRQPCPKSAQTPAEVLQAKLGARESLLEREKNFTFMTLLGQDGSWRLQPQAGD